MKLQHQVVLSIGSNQGNRLQNIEKCLQYIHNEMATIVKVSNLYESESWGFQSDSFFNAAVLVHTFASAEQILAKAIEIEQKMGRKRTNASEYQSRIIDIDIVAFDNEVIKTAELIIPHQFMQDRLFVLKPMLDLEWEWSHPLLNQSVLDLVKITKDESQCKFVQKLQSPLQKIKVESLNYIAFEGNIGAGKTTLVTKIAQDFRAKSVYERFADNPFLPQFYKDPNRYAFPLEMSFLADRYKQLTDDLAQLDLFSDFIVADYHIFKSLIFAKITLPEDEFRLYNNLFHILYKDMPKPDLYVYLYQKSDRLLQNIKLRGREYEQEISADYLDKINNGYLEYIKSQTELNVLIIDITELDFVQNQSDYLFVLDEIQKKIQS